MPNAICNPRERETTGFAHERREDRFETWYQPIIDTTRHSIIGHECLIRLCGERTYREAEIVQRARTLGYSGSPGELFFVNVIPAAISDPIQSMRSTVESISSRELVALTPKDFVFQVPQQESGADQGWLKSIREWVRRHGAGIALDRIGIGANSFELIRELQPDYVRIDPRLIWNVEKPVCAATIRKVLEVAERYDARVIAAGVERARVAENLWLLGVQIMQGSLFGEPSPEILRPWAHPIN